MSQLSDWKRAHMCTENHVCTYVQYTCTMVLTTLCHNCTYVRTYGRTYNVMSQLSDWKRAHMCTENHVCFGRIHGSQLREVRTYNVMSQLSDWKGRTCALYVLTMLCHNFLIGKGKRAHMCTENHVLPMVIPMVLVLEYHWYTCTYVRTDMTNITNLEND
jgi:hypothetical protein